MRFDSIFKFLFVLYCLEAGLFLLIAPWTDGWDRFALLLTFTYLRALAVQPWLRGLFSGFGLVHLLWAAHDIDLLLRGTPESAPPSPTRRQ